VEAPGLFDDFDKFGVPRMKRESSGPVANGLMQMDMSVRPVDAKAAGANSA
jgi:hypothetical protein